ncbi:uncharacterized protein LOC129593874 [Paramacrobiotus metropolitanus]|uniref:uncharacterized protein LOC129593874 n=1 Tax=Paramacrobiotus metropolitanus TaxID=2943436 RepID=UPI00244593AA|nr:uncharacterized protein LOC129593874 [Paramacrobiotus metropolitanus]
MRVKIPALFCFSAFVTNGRCFHSCSEKLNNTTTKQLKVLRNPQQPRRPSASTVTEPLGPQFRYRQRLFDYINSDPKFSTQLTQSVGDASKAASDHSDFADPNLLGSSLFSHRLNDWLAIAEAYLRAAEIDLRTPAFHRIFLQKLENLDTGITVHEALQSLLYCANYRKISERLEDSLRRVIVAKASELRPKDIEVLAFSAYILKITFSAHPDFLQHLADVISSSNMDFSSIVTILKFFRQNSFIDRNFLERLADRLIKLQHDELKSVECCHFLQSFSAARFYDAHLYELLQSSILDTMQQQLGLYDTLSPDALTKLHPSERFRPKDMANYLYALAHVNHPIRDVNFVFAELSRRLTEFERFPYLLVQALYALSMQAQYNTDLLKIIFSPGVSRKLAREGWKDARRWLYCLYKNCQLEFPSGVTAVGISEARLAAGLPRDFEKAGLELSKREEKKLYNVGEVLKKLYGKEAVWWGRAVPQVELAGFVVSILGGDIVEMVSRGTPAICRCPCKNSRWRLWMSRCSV